MKWLGLAAVLVLAAAAWWMLRSRGVPPNPNEYTVERTDYNPPPPKDAELFADDKPDAANPPAFDAARVDSRPLEGWEVNLSGAYTKLDCPILKPDQDAELLALRPTYAAALAAARRSGLTVLPSVNAIDGKAKQFDDGLYAALDLAYYRGVKDKLKSHVDVFRRLHAAVGGRGEAGAFLAAGLHFAEVDAPCEDAAAKQRFVSSFESEAFASKPIGFYTWTPELGRLFRFLRFFSQEFAPRQIATIRALADAARKDAALRADLEKMTGFFAKLTNKLTCLTLVEALDAHDDKDLIAKAQKLGRHRPTVALLPRSESKEYLLFEALFPEGVPPTADLMKELVNAIRSGKVDLEPSAESGWYEHQVYALETLLLQKKGAESERLVLTASYKKRMLEAFQALITKRRETHVRQLSDVKSDIAKRVDPPPLASVAPRLRLEPAPTYYLRTARAYAFLANFLESAVGADTMKSLKGLKEGGERQLDLHAELAAMRKLFYGCYLLSAEDIGLATALKPSEVADAAACKTAAEDWLRKFADDPDMAVDTRVIVPVYNDLEQSKSHVWATVGVRLARLNASYGSEYPPWVRAKGKTDWTRATYPQLRSAEYVIAVDEFVSAVRPKLTPLTRAEFRALCDAAKTKEDLVQKLTAK